MDRTLLLDEADLGVLGKPTPRGYATAPAIWSQSTPRGIGCTVVRERPWANLPQAIVANFVILSAHCFFCVSDAYQ